VEKHEEDIDEKRADAPNETRTRINVDMIATE
jgi:hypothetical protein